MKRAGFTLLEAIIVIVILAILAAIIWPVLQRPHYGEANRNSCQVNLKQISLCFKEYVMDSDGNFPLFNGGGTGVTRYGRYRATHWVRSLQPYSKGIQIFQCPSEANSVGTDYFYSRRASGQMQAKFPHSAETVLLAEGNDTLFGSQATMTAPITAGMPPAFSRHRAGSNYAFIDGHVKWLQSAQAPGQQPASQGGFTFNS